MLGGADGRLVLSAFVLGFATGMHSRRDFDSSPLIVHRALDMGTSKRSTAKYPAGEFSTLSHSAFSPYSTVPSAQVRIFRH